MLHRDRCQHKIRAHSNKKDTLNPIPPAHSPSQLLFFLDRRRPYNISNSCRKVHVRRDWLSYASAYLFCILLYRCENPDHLLVLLSSSLCFLLRSSQLFVSVAIHDSVESRPTTLKSAYTYPTN